MSQIQKKDRRQFIRLKAHHLVKYKSLSQEEQRIPILATIRDIGAGGICLKTEKHLPLSSLIELKINFPHVTQAIFALAKVIWIKPRIKGRLYEIGAQFVQMDESVRKIIEEQVKTVYKRLKQKKGILSKCVLWRRG